MLCPARLLPTRLLVVVFSTVLSGWAIAAYLTIEPSLSETTCLARLHAIGGNVFGPNGPMSIDKYATIKTPGCVCACCGKPLVYQPRPDKPVGGWPGYPARYLVAWCPAPCHKNKRGMLFSDGYLSMMPETQFESIFASAPLLQPASTRAADGDPCANLVKNVLLPFSSGQ